MRIETTLVVALSLAFLPGCLGAEMAHHPQAPKHKTWEDDGEDPWDNPERTTREKPDAPPPRSTDDVLPRSPDPQRPNVKVELTVLDVISWDDVKIRGGVRGSIVRGVVSLTGWLAPSGGKGKSSRRTTQFVVVAAGREASLELSDPAVRDLIGAYHSLRVAVIDANDKGEVDVAVAPLTSATDDGQVTIATRVRVGSGEGLVVGGFRAEDEGDDKTKKRDQIVILTATVLR